MSLLPPPPQQPPPPSTSWPPPAPPPSWPPPPPANWPPAGRPPASTGRRLLVLFAVLAVIAALTATVAVVVHNRRSGPSHPAQWDARVLDIVHFDEQHRGLKFKHPVEVDFLTPEQYTARARSDASQLSEQDKKDLQNQAGELRALGLMTGDVDLFSASNELVDTGTAAFYDPDTDRVSVRGTDMTVELKVTLAHELTHALQAQHFDISTKRFDSFKTSGASESFRALVEGDATRIENEYIESLSADDKATYEQSNSASVEHAQQQLSNVPAALQALQAAPYFYGPPFTAILDEHGGQRAVDAAFGEPPVDDEQEIDPRQFIDGHKPIDVAKPSLPEGVKDETDSGDLGATAWYLMLAERIPPLQALQAADGWGGDAYVAYEQDGRTCMRIAWKGDTTQDEDEMRTALDAWQAAMPAGTTNVDVHGDLLTVQACDPGATSGITINNRSLDALQLLAVRSYLMLSAVRDGGLSLDEGFDFGQCVVDKLPFDTIVQVATSNDEPPAAFTAALSACH